MDITTFGAFTTARLGIFAAQKALDVTGHNISNINTSGYTRQKVDQVSLRVGASNHYASAFGGAAGSGVLITGMSQFRDPYLDIRFRNETSSVGAMDAKLAGLEDLTEILDEVGTGAEGAKGEGILEAQFNDLKNQLANLTADHATEDEYLALVRSSADSLIKLLNNYAKRLETVKENQEDGFRQDVDNVNDILSGIRTLNDTILKSEVYGDSALELRDQRNTLIDELAKYMKVNVTYEAVSIGAGKTVDKLVIKTVGDDSKTLVDGDYAGKISIDGNRLVENPAYKTDPTQPKYLKPDGTATDLDTEAERIEYALNLSPLKNQNNEVKTGSQEVQFSDTELYGALQATRELLTASGEFTSVASHGVNPNATTQRGIPYYQNALDAMARKFATVMNEANTGYLRDADGNIVNKDDGKVLAVKNSTGKYQIDTNKDGTIDASDAEFELKDLEKEQEFSNHAKLLGGNLFSISGAGDEATEDVGGVIFSKITAANISISKSWSTDAGLLQNSFLCVAGTAKPGSSDASNILHIMAQFDSSQDYTPADVVQGAVDGNTNYFKGSFQQMLTNVQATLAQDTKSTTTLLENYSAATTNLNSNRDGVSSVDLNDEAMNLMQFQKSYSAACRLMTTLDETLDKLINGTGVVGR